MLVDLVIEKRAIGDEINRARSCRTSLGCVRNYAICSHPFLAALYRDYMVNYLSNRTLAAGREESLESGLRAFPERVFPPMRSRRVTREPGPLGRQKETGKRKEKTRERKDK